MRLMKYYDYLVCVWPRRCNMAGRGNANGVAIRVPGTSIDDGDNVIAFDAHPGLVNHRTGCLQRFHLYHRMDRRFSHDKHARSQIQTRIILRN